MAIPFNPTERPPPASAHTASEAPSSEMLLSHLDLYQLILCICFITYRLSQNYWYFRLRARGALISSGLCGTAIDTKYSTKNSTEGKNLSNTETDSDLFFH